MTKKLLTDFVLKNISLSEYEFVNREHLKESLRGVYHDEDAKTMVATNGYAMYLSKPLYNEDFAGTIVKEDGEVPSSDVKFPVWRNAVPDLSTYESCKVNMESLAKAVKDMGFLYTMAPGVRVSVSINGYLIAIQYAEKLLRFMLLNGVKHILFSKFDYDHVRPIVARSEQETLILMPVVSRYDEQYVEVKVSKK